MSSVPGSVEARERNLSIDSLIAYPGEEGALISDQWN
jgi:hypothetical protein